MTQKEWVKRIRWAMSIGKNIFTKPLIRNHFPMKQACALQPFPRRAHPDACSTWRQGLKERFHVGQNLQTTAPVCSSSQEDWHLLPKRCHTAAFPYSSATPCHQTVLISLLSLHVPSWSWHTEGEPRFPRNGAPGFWAGRHSHLLLAMSPGAS